VRQRPRQRITLHGPVVRLPPKHALTLTLTLHELATNAAKYGALGDAGGELHIEWMVSLDGSGRRLAIEWIESKVKGIVMDSVTASFGTRLIKNGVVHDLQGQCEHKLRADGLTCIINVPF
jgi:two-component sensor histidine kinase